MEQPVRVLHVRPDSRGEAPGEDPVLADDRIVVDRAGGDVSADQVGDSDCVVVDDASEVDPMAVGRSVRRVAPDVPVVVAAPPDRPRADETLVVGANWPDGSDHPAVPRTNADEDLDLAALVLAVTGGGAVDDESSESNASDETGEPGDTEGIEESGDPGEIAETDHTDRPVDAAKVRALHRVAVDLMECETDTAVFQRAAEAADDLLEFDQSVVYEREGNELLPTVATTGETVIPREEVATFGVDEAAMGHVYQTGESIVVDDAQANEVTEPTSPTIRSGICVPLGEFGVFNAISDRRGAFDREDLAMAEILSAHVTTAVERIRSDARTRRERNRFVALFESVPDAVVITDPAGEDPRIREVNRMFEQTFGVDRDAVEGDRFSDHVGLPPGEERIDVPEDGYRVAEIRRETPEGVREFLFRGFPAELGDDPQHVAIFTDITERNARQRELERKTERLDEFASIVSHDLRNPLSVAKGWLEVLEEDPDDEAVREIESALARMESLIEDLLTLSREGWTIDHPNPIDGRRAVERAWDNVATGDATIDCEWDATVRADEGRLVEIFENVFRNAVEHAGDGANVRVEPLDGEPGVFVADDGPGIDPEVGETLFDLGVSTAGGTGLGLGIVRRIVEAHGWSIRATEGDRGGARFEIHFGDAGVEGAIDEDPPVGGT